MTDESLNYSEIEFKKEAGRIFFLVPNSKTLQYFGIIFDDYGSRICHKLMEFIFFRLL